MHPMSSRSPLLRPGFLAEHFVRRGTVLAVAHLRPFTLGAAWTGDRRARGRDKAEVAELAVQADDKVAGAAVAQHAEAGHRTAGRSLTAGIAARILVDPLGDAADGHQQRSDRAIGPHFQLATRGGVPAIEAIRPVHLAGPI